MVHFRNNFYIYAGYILGTNILMKNGTLNEQLLYICRVHIRYTYSNEEWYTLGTTSIYLQGTF